MSASIRALAITLLLLACEGAITQPVAVWPPAAGEPCGEARDVCEDGHLWRCGYRPLWELVDCHEECEALGMAPRGCVLSEATDRAAFARRQGFVDIDRGVPAGRCLCGPSEGAECAGPAHRVCANQVDLWICDESLRWRTLSCVDACAAARPPMALVGCQNAADFDDWGIRADTCICTAIGAPCDPEGALTCSDDYQWLRCLDGRWRADLDCLSIDCPDDQGARCDRRAAIEPACVCGPRPR
ncbi:MAG TPA: hypothetical protein PKW35_07610 [Nannocystaceae bacterium]|nr:hypothetical protein [Nannocystaceae bacterium]